MKLTQRAPVSEFRDRIRWMVLVVLVGIAALVVRVIYLQVARAKDYATLAEDNVLRRIFLPSTRGVIRDARGRVIAANRPSYNVYIVPQFVLHPNPERPDPFPKLVQYLGLNREDRDRLEARIHQSDGPAQGRQVLAREDVDRETLAVLETHRDELSGVSVVAVPVRTYPFRDLASHAIGFLNEVSEEDITQHAGEDYHPGDRMGRSGVERAWESLLRGRRGWMRIERGLTLSSREEMARLSPGHLLEPVPGRDLTLTLDMELMRAIDRAFTSRSFAAGAAAVVDVHNGHVLALYSRPALDPNVLSAGLTSAMNREIDDNPYRPRIDRTIYETYFPGSTFKPFSALAALHNGLDPHARITCVGHVDIGERNWHCAHGESHGVVDLHQGIVQSCNIYFFDLCTRILTMDTAFHMAQSYGLGERTGIGINAESTGFVPSRAWYGRMGSTFRIGYTLNMAIGQGNTRTTVLQMALAYAALANGGTLYVPQLVDSVLAPDGAMLQSFPPAVRRHIDVSAADLALVTSALRGVVAEPRGTAHRQANIPDVDISGKTGTAQVSRLARQGEDPHRAWYEARDHAWFAAFAPSAAPEIAVVVLVEHGGSGGSEAAPVVASIVRDYFTRIRPGEPIPSVRAIRDRQDGATGHGHAHGRGH